MDSKRSLSARRRCLHAVTEREFASLRLLAERETTVLRVVQEERVAALQALAERGTETSAGREALAADRAALESEIGAMEAAARRQNSRVLLSVGGAFFETSCTTLTVVLGSMLEAMFSRRHSIATDEDGRVFIDRDGEHFGLILNFLYATAARTLPLARSARCPTRSCTRCVASSSTTASMVSCSETGSRSIVRCSSLGRRWARRAPYAPPSCCPADEKGS